ncbi:hypothetical protein [Halopenitus malekzadehii]
MTTQGNSRDAALATLDEAVPFHDECGSERFARLRMKPVHESSTPSATGSTETRR